jgi:hypothetical protein
LTQGTFPTCPDSGDKLDSTVSPVDDDGTFARLRYVSEMPVLSILYVSGVPQRTYAPWLSWLQRPTVIPSGDVHRKVVSSSLTGAVHFSLLFFLHLLLFVSHVTRGRCL